MLTGVKEPLRGPFVKMSVGVSILVVEFRRDCMIGGRGEEAIKRTIRRRRKGNGERAVCKVKVKEGAEAYPVASRSDRIAPRGS